MITQSRFNYTTTLIILCIGYFIDFYDLTIFSASYNELIPEQFHIFDPIKIQQLYLYMVNWHSFGIFIGAILFGIMGDKFGRTHIIRYSILLYSSAIILSIFTKSIVLFAVLRLITGMGLASEFAISSVLISELFSVKAANRGAAVLYASGILGGITATFISCFSWKIMFLLGGVSGILIYLARSKLYESHLFAKISQVKNINKGRISEILCDKFNLIKTFKLYLIYLPFQLLISIMFIFPNFMPLALSNHVAVKILLIGFFAGNLISTCLSGFLINWLKSYRIYMIINVILYIVIMPLFPYISKSTYFYYCLSLGLLGGGFPTLWMQLASKSYGINIRSTAANLLFAMGRASGILFNTLISYCLFYPKLSIMAFQAIILIVTITSLACTFKTKDTYAINADFLN